MRKFFGKLLSTLLITLMFFYASCVLIEQERELRNIEKEIDRYQVLLDEATIKTEELKEVKSKINTDEYIEAYAREKLGLVMPHEIIFVDASV